MTAGTYPRQKREENFISKFKQSYVCKISQTQPTLAYKQTAGKVTIQRSATTETSQ